MIYADWRASSLGEITEALEHHLLFTLIGPLAGKAVLDVGCGDGALLMACHRSGAGLIAGCDPDERMVRRAREQAMAAGAAMPLAIARGQALPFPDACFDVVTCVTVLTFVRDADTVVSEMARVLRPGGCLIVGDLGKWSLWAVRRRIRAWFGAVLWRGARFRRARSLAALLRGAGLTIIAVQGAIFFPPWTAAARRLARFDRCLGSRTTFGAAFVAVRGIKR